MRLYHFLSKTWALDDIAKRRLKLSRIDALNDPFELLSMALDDRQLRDGATGWKRQMAHSYGILCFSKKSTNPVQWSHYADRHTGICLGFDVPDSSLIPVQYVRRRVLAQTVKEMLATEEAEAEAAMKKLLATKFAHWRYEAEVRTFHRLDEKDERGLFFANFDDGLVLREVIVGALSDTTRKEVEEAIGDLPDVVAHKKRLAFKTFSVVRNRNGALWT